MKKKSTVCIHSEIDVDDVIDGLTASLSHDQLFNFIKKLDEQVCEWDFTLKCYKHFNGLKEKYDEEMVKEQL
jgi:hypothetical protein